MMWDDDENKDIKIIFLDFLIKCLNDFRHRDSSTISLKEGIDYVNDFVDGKYK